LIQDMVGGVLSLVADVKGLILNMRLSGAAKTFGMGFGSSQDAIAASDSWAASIEQRDSFKSGPRWAAGLQASIDNLRKQSADAAAAWKASQGSVGLLDGIISDAKSFGMGSLESWKGAGKGLFGAASGGFMKMAMDAGAMKPKSMDRPALSFAQSGSVESYRQQAAIRRQSENIAKKQLNVQEQIRDGIDGLAGLLNFPVANLGKG
jgi:hypothetical protein